MIVIADTSGPRTAIIDFIRGQAQRLRFQIAETTVEVLETARLVQRRYEALRLDLADAVNVAIAAEYRTDVARAEVPEAAAWEPMKPGLR